MRDILYFALYNKDDRVPVKLSLNFFFFILYILFPENGFSDIPF